MNRLYSICLFVLAAICTSAEADDQLEMGKQLYEIYCTSCHGLTGDGWGINAEHMQTEPADHTENGEMDKRSDDELFKAIKYGGKSLSKSVLMPKWEGNMTDEQINLLVAYIRSLCCTKNQ